MNRFWTLLPLFALVTACAPHRIPGTDLDDTPEVRAILQLLERYRVALENREAPTLIALADPTFRDDGGTPNTDDDLDYSTLSSVLPQRLAKLSDVKLELDVRKIDVSADRRRAVATFYFTARFRPVGLEAKTQREMDLKQMTLKSDGTQWRVTSGY